jgi:Kef-type K+ transport system membrane component KefB
MGCAPTGRRARPYSGRRLLLGLRGGVSAPSWLPGCWAGNGEASLIGWLLQTKALIMIIFANILLDRNFISSETFTALLLMAVASTMLTIPMAAPMVARMQSIRFRSV